jgi:hypothetical protein
MSCVEVLRVILETMGFWTLAAPDDEEGALRQARDALDALHGSFLTVALWLMSALFVLQRSNCDSSPELP